MARTSRKKRLEGLSPLPPFPLSLFQGSTPKLGPSSKDRVLSRYTSHIYHTVPPAASHFITLPASLTPHSPSPGQSPHQAAPCWSPSSIHSHIHTRAHYHSASKHTSANDVMAKDIGFTQAEALRSHKAAARDLPRGGSPLKSPVLCGPLEGLHLAPVLPAHLEVLHGGREGGENERPVSMSCRCSGPYPPSPLTLFPPA